MDNVLKNKIENLAEAAGVYFFKDDAERVIYVGKAKNLKKRVKNHFQKPDQHRFDFVAQIADIDFVQTSSEKEALLLEQQLIKKLQPRWNAEWKDDKNYFYIACGEPTQTAFSDDEFPRIYLTHQIKKLTEVEPLSVIRGSTSVNNYFGPFVSGREVKGFLKEIRKAIPYRTCRNRSSSADLERSEGLPKKPCLYYDLRLCLAPCVNKTKKSKKDYDKIISLLRVLLFIYQGNFYGINCGGLTPAEKKMRGSNPRKMRVEGYDISNLQGTLATGSMVVFEGGLPNKNEYRKFKIKTVEGQNDVASLAEVLKRRMKHQEWALPDLILLDGGKGQLKAAKGFDLPTIALAKIGDKDGKLFSKFSKNYAQLSKLPKEIAHLLIKVRDESHRFAIGYNKKCREININ